MIEFLNDTSNLIGVSFMMGILLTVIIYFFTKRLVNPKSVQVNNVKQNKDIFIGQYIIMLLQRYGTCDIKFLINRKTSTNLDAKKVFLDLDNLLYFSKDIYNELIDNMENGYSSTKKSGYYRAELSGRNIIIKMQYIPRIKMTLNQLANLNSANNFNGIINNNSILGHDAFLYLTHTQFEKKLAQY
ncbi:hypothetical protein BU107_04670 [Staphylococcus xylosus]|uniref:hypothetical protein n=1 Tax=Staphylococcus xylosus TaxID=1288 RepID=UPI000E696DB8|nr:hypothetical protein [Staphylococcus xylosus]RIM88900.1 hypothetical protein BU107_04670 [Staphylococcus xylosus]